MKITWTEPGVECSLAVYWRSENGNSAGSREPTLADLKRASEVGGLLSDYVDRYEADKREQKLKVRLAVLEAEQAAYLDALAVDGLRPTSVLVGIESLKSVAAGLREEVADADAIASRANATAEKAIAELKAQIRAAQDTSIADRAMDKFAAAGIPARGVLDGIEQMQERLRYLESARGELHRQVDALEKTAAVNERYAKALAADIQKYQSENHNLHMHAAELESRASRWKTIANAYDLNESATPADVLGQVSRVTKAAIADVEAVLARVSREREAAIDDVAAVLTNHDRPASIQEAIAALIAELNAACAMLGSESGGPSSLYHRRTFRPRQGAGALVRCESAHRHFALANEAYDEFQARFDEPVTSAERIALLEALEPHNPNAARAAAAMDREHAATRAVLGASDGEDLISAARRAVSLADLYRTHYRRTVIANAMTDRAMTEGLAECERLRARIAELETAAAKRESLRDLMEKAAEARLSCGLYIPREGLIEVGVGRGGQTHADTPKNAVWEFERLLRERVGAGNTL